MVINKKKENTLKLFQEQTIRTHWDEEQDKWFFSIQDVVQILAETPNVKDYIKKMKKRDAELNSNWGTICPLVQMQAADGKMRKIQAADTQGLFRIIQSIPSSKAEPFKRWLAKVGADRIEETEDPELAFERAMDTYLKKGYSKEWINQRLKSIEIRKDLTDEWDDRGVKKGLEYAILTDELTKAWAGLSIKEYKMFKSLKKENLRDNMSNLELVLNMLAEATTTEISKKQKPETFNENKTIAKKGERIAGNTKKEIEAQTGEEIVTARNAKTVITNSDSSKIGKKI